MNGTGELYRDALRAMSAMHVAETPAGYAVESSRLYDAFKALDDALKGGAPLPTAWLNPVDPG